MIKMRLHLIALALFSACLPLAASAQEVVQSAPNPAAQELSEALLRLSRSPESVPALVEAGRASLALDDADAALGFFSRAQAVQPGDGRVLAGLALVALDRGDAVLALEFFTQSSAAGHSLAAYAAERALAFDLVGRNDEAQRLYTEALRRNPSDVVTRRLALSYAISGNAAQSERLLWPLLQRQDAGAFRTRAFALAILGRESEAVTIAETMLPARLSGRLAPYLRYMPRLTGAQQAAAANLGRFPAIADIGRDAPQLAQAATSPPARSTAADTRLIPAGEALGNAAPQQVSATAQSPESLPEAQMGVLPPVGQTVARTAAQPVAAAAPVVVARMEERPAPRVAATVSVPQVQELPAAPVPSVSETVQMAQVQQAPPEPAAPPPALDLADAFADFSLGNAAAPTRRGDVVDITSFVPAREVAAPEPAPQPAAPPPPVHPSRHWVQVATGRDASAFRFDWRRIARNSDGLLADYEPKRASWGQTNRLVTGPFDSASDAQKFVRELAGAGVSAFRWTSDTGEEVTGL